MYDYCLNYYGPILPFFMPDIIVLYLPIMKQAGKKKMTSIFIKVGMFPLHCDTFTYVLNEMCLEFLFPQTAMSK